MSKAIEMLKAVVLAALAVVLLSIFVFVKHLDKTLDGVQATNTALNGVIVKAGTTVDGINTTLAEVNRPCGGGHPCGTLADVAKTLHTVRGTVGEVEMVAHHEDQRIGILDAQEASIYQDTHTAIGKLSTALDTTNTTIASLQPVTRNLGSEVEELHTATTSLNNLVNDPDIKSSITHVDRTTGDVADMADETKQAVHDFFHPKLAKRIYDTITGVGIDVAKFFF